LGIYFLVDENEKEIFIIIITIITIFTVAFLNPSIRLLQHRKREVVFLAALAAPSTGQGFISGSQKVVMRTGVARLPLHYGSAPPWLFRRMVRLGRAISEVIVLEWGRKEFLERLADPFWFQAFGCVLGFDWHSSGLTTTVTGALKEACLEDLGFGVCGGKGKASRKAPGEILETGDRFSLGGKKIENLMHSSRMAAKVDSAAVQDSYQLYHHAFFFTEKGEWCVVQQGMNTQTRYARRYHWLSENVKSPVEEPHSAICCDKRGGRVLDMTAAESREAREASVAVVRDSPKEVEKLLCGRNCLQRFSGQRVLVMPRSHYIAGMNKRNLETLKKAHEIQPRNYEELLGVKGLGPAGVRALALVSELVYGKPPSWKDPAGFSFAHGGKDGIPYPVDRKGYDRSVEVMESAIENAKLGSREKLSALKRLGGFLG
jgi:hypothetical protein